MFQRLKILLFMFLSKRQSYYKQYKFIYLVTIDHFTLVSYFTKNTLDFFTFVR